MSKVSVSSGMVYGKVDWVTKDGHEFGMFLRTSSDKTTRVIVGGKEAKSMLSNNIVQKGMMVAATGEMSARCFSRATTGEDEGEVVVFADRIVAEPPTEGRLRGTVYNTLKGTIMYWDEKTLLLKTYLNYTEPGRASVAVSLNMRPWLSEMSEESQARFKAAVRSGRDFTAMSLVEVQCYTTREKAKAVSLMLLPTDFKLQG